jgi:hypothetical protein
MPEPDPALRDAYADAWREWEEAGESAVWECTTNDGLDLQVGSELL